MKQVLDIHCNCMWKGNTVKIAFVFCMQLLLASLSNLECLELFEVLLQMWVLN
jgi:hypothetical protein